MSDRTVDIRDAMTHLLRLIARVEQGERVVIARAGKPVAELRPPRKVKKHSNPLDDPLLRVDEYSYAGPIRQAADDGIDGTV